MAAAPADRDLLFGILALQMSSIGRDDLVAAMNDWVLEKGRPLGQILVDRGALDPEDHALLAPIVDRHLDRHGGDPARGLAALSSATTARQAVASVADPDVQATLAHLDAPADDRGRAGNGDATVTFAAGTPTSAGSRFRVLRPHARGGLGEVYVARDEELGRQVALKEIQADKLGDPASRSRFVREAEINGNLEHPGIVPVYGLGAHDDGRPYYAMRFIEGDSLKEAIATFHEAKPGLDASVYNLRLRQLLGRFLAVCDAVAYAHSRGVLHRDLKPANVMLGRFGETLVVDWGLAKATGRTDFGGAAEGAVEKALALPSDAGAGPTVAGSALGTPGFMSPEQAEGKVDDLGPATDIYSLGATLYTLLTGRPPVGGRKLAEVLADVRCGKIPPPRSVAPRVPAALAAICLKALATRPGDRYASCRSLAEDLQRWLADEPVSAYREPLPARARRWARRHRTAVTGAAVAALLLAGGATYFAYLTSLQAQRDRARAEGFVAALEAAEIRAVPGLVDQLGEDRALVRDDLARLADAGPGSPGWTAANLALLPDRPGRADRLLDRLLDPGTSPGELLIIREALADQGHLAEAAGRLEAMIGEDADGATLDDVQLRALGALTLAGPEHPRWRPRPDTGVEASGPPDAEADVGPPAAADPASRRALAARLAAKLVAENALLLDAWKAVFRPVSRALLDDLRGIYADRSAPEARAKAFELLLAYAAEPDNPSRAEDLAMLLPEADPARLDRVVARLGDPGDRARAVAVLGPQLDPIAKFDDARAARQGRIAVALARLGDVESVWPLFQLRDDAGVRTELVHELAPNGVDVALVIARLRAEEEVSARRALVLCLGEYPTGRIPGPDREALAEELLSWYRTEPDAGLHGAIGWLLRRRWGMAEEVEAIDRGLITSGPPTDRDWFVNAEGQTYTVVRDPGEYLMGSTDETEHYREIDEIRHRRLIPRSFAIAAREVTLAEWSRFLDANADRVRQYGEDVPEGQDRPILDLRENANYRQSVPTFACSVGVVPLYDAMRYCNWLSAQDGLPEDQWCYPSGIGPAMELTDDFLERAGYRLPTEGEWEFSCRAGTASSRPFGRIESRLVHYEWYQANNSSVMSPPGLLKPNDLGLFDVMGNAYEWCQDTYEGYPVPSDGSLTDVLVQSDDPNALRVVRGGSFNSSPLGVRSADRYGVQPTFLSADFGLRPVRTLP